MVVVARDLMVGRPSARNCRSTPGSLWTTRSSARRLADADLCLCMRGELDG